MKIEIGESLIYSWLRHVKECQVVQMNWKASKQWDLNNRDQLDKLMKKSSDFFKKQFAYDIYKESKDLTQLLKQAEIDVLGICSDLTNGSTKIFAIDVAFHENGLNYGRREETVARILKKCLRTAICINGYFGASAGTIIFASPKIGDKVHDDLKKAMKNVKILLDEAGLHFDVEIIANESFAQRIVDPVIKVSKNVADTSELFIRSLQMNKLSEEIKAKYQHSTASLEPNVGYSEMKIGVIVRTILRDMFEEEKVSKEETNKFTTLEYSKDIFGIQFPLLCESEQLTETLKRRYYVETLDVHEKKYYLCNDWYEKQRDNVLAWISKNQ